MRVRHRERMASEPGPLTGETFIRIRVDSLAKGANQCPH